MGYRGLCIAAGGRTGAQTFFQNLININGLFIAFLYTGTNPARAGLVGRPGLGPPLQRAGYQGIRKTRSFLFF